MLLSILYVMSRYIFPAMGLAAVCTRARHILDSDFYVAAVALAKQVIFLKHH